LTETDWVYAGTVINQADSVIINIRRFRLDKPEVSEPAWSKTPLNIDNFQLSADGKRASGLFPWPSCGVAVLPDREWKKFGDGCWPSLSPDSNLLFWIFDGSHRNLTLFRTKTDERWVVNINNTPGIDGFEVYHPRWSNHPLFMVMTGPYKLGDGSNRIRGGGKDVEIYLGKFSEDFKKIERWIKITHNKNADFFPDLWLATPKEWQAIPAKPSENGLQEKKKASADAWPGSFDGLVFYWQNRSKANTFTDPVTQFSCVCRVEAKGRARYGRHFEMAPSGGAFIADGGAGELIDKCAANRQLAIEAVVTPEVNISDRLLPIVGYAAKTGTWNFMLGQKENQLVFQMRSEKTEKNYTLTLGALASNVPSHVIVSCSSSSIACYLDGKQISCHDSVFGGNWERGSIVFGNELRGEYAVDPGNSKSDWKGLIENVALYSRWIGPEEAQKKYIASVEKISNREQIPVLSAKAKLVSMPVTPAPESIAPYRRALMVGQYQIELVTEGACSNRDVMVAQWAILDGQALNSAQRQEREKGREYQLRLEQFSDHPELEGERLIMDSDRFDLPLFYDVGDY